MQLYTVRCIPSILVCFEIYLEMRLETQIAIYTRNTSTAPRIHRLLPKHDDFSMNEKTKVCMKQNSISPYLFVFVAHLHVLQ